MGTVTLTILRGKPSCENTGSLASNFVRSSREMRDVGPMTMCTVEFALFWSFWLRVLRVLRARLGLYFEFDELKLLLLLLLDGRESEEAALVMPSLVLLSPVEGRMSVKVDCAIPLLWLVDGPNSVKLDFHPLLSMVDSPDSVKVDCVSARVHSLLSVHDLVSFGVQLGVHASMSLAVHPSSAKVLVLPLLLLLPLVDGRDLFFVFFEVCEGTGKGRGGGEDKRCAGKASGLVTRRKCWISTESCPGMSLTALNSCQCAQ